MNKNTPVHVVAYGTNFFLSVLYRNLGTSKAPMMLKTLSLEKKVDNAILTYVRTFYVKGKIAR